MESSVYKLKSVPIYVSSTNSEEYSQLCYALKHSKVIALDAEWKPNSSTAALLQLACQVIKTTDSHSVEEEEDKKKKKKIEVEVAKQTDCLIFLVDLVEIDIPMIWEVLKEMFVSAEVLKLGFRFKQDLRILSSTFSSHGCEPGFELVEPYIEIASVYYGIHSGEESPKDNISLAAICKKLLRVSLSKEQQCSDWSCRPLEKKQKEYAAADVECLLEIFDNFQEKFHKEGISCPGNNKLHFPNAILGPKKIVENCDEHDNVLTRKYFQASDLIRFDTVSESTYTAAGPLSNPLCISKIPLDVSLAELVRGYGENLLLKESDRKLTASKKKRKVKSCVECQGPPPDLSLEGDGFPKFLCDTNVAVAKHLQSVGFDAALPNFTKPSTSQILKQVNDEKRFLLTKDPKVFKHHYLAKNQAYQVESCRQNDQLLEVILALKLKIPEDYLKSLCLECLWRSDLTTEEDDVTKNILNIPRFLFEQKFFFWECINCKRVSWGGHFFGQHGWI